MLDRKKYLSSINAHFQIHSICALLGPRQVGKTTLAKLFSEQNYKNSTRFFDLENPLDLARLENPMLTLSQEPEKLVVDEIQLRPDLFPMLTQVCPCSFLNYCK